MFTKQVKMTPEIRTLPEKKLIGQHLQMNMAQNKTFELWRNFMPRRKEIKNNLDNDLFSMQVYPTSFNFQNFDIHATFEKWAAIEVEDFSNIPIGMEAFNLVGGLYAVFIHKGPASEGERTFRYIFETCIPNSDYVIDNRPHFEIIGEKYKNDDPNSEEEVWVPIKKRA